MRLTQKGVDIGVVLAERARIFNEKFTILNKISSQMEKFAITPSSIAKYNINIAKDGVLRTAGQILSQKGC